MVGYKDFLINDMRRYKVVLNTLRIVLYYFLYVCKLRRAVIYATGNMCYGTVGKG